MIKNGACAPEGNFNFAILYYCYFANFGPIGMKIAFIFIGGLFLYLSMYILAATADLYLSPCFEYIS